MERRKNKTMMNDNLQQEQQLRSSDKELKGLKSRFLRSAI